MLKLYHGKGSLASQKVRLAFAEKGLEFESSVVSPPDRRSPGYLKINRNGLVPSLESDGRIIIESRVINEYLDEIRPDPPLQMTAPYDRALVRSWTAQDDQLHLNVFTLSFLIEMRDSLASLPVHERRDKAPGLNDPAKMERALDIAEHGFLSPCIAQAVQRFDLLFADMDIALGHSAWLAGDQYTLAETDIAPYLYRLQNIGFAALWQDYPRVQDWFERVQARPSFKTAVLDWLSDAEFARMKQCAETAKSNIARLLDSAEP